MQIAECTYQEIYIKEIKWPLFDSVVSAWNHLSKGLYRNVLYLHIQYQYSNYDCK